MENTTNGKGPGRQSEPFETSTTSNDRYLSALVAGYQLQKLAGLLGWLGRYLADAGGPFAQQGMSVALMARKIDEDGTDMIRRALARLSKEALALVPPAVMMPNPPAPCPLASGSYLGTCWTAPCSHWRKRMGGSAGTCGILAIGGAP